MTRYNQLNKWLVSIIKTNDLFIFRLEKLKNVIRKAFSKFGKLTNEHYPLDEEGKTKGKFTSFSFYTLVKLKLYY